MKRLKINKEQRKQLLELDARTHPCWTWHWCFRKLLKTPL